MISPKPAYLSEIVERIVRQFDPLRIILFGSWARGDARPDSDVDLLVVLPKVEHDNNWKIKDAFPHLYDLSVWAVESRYPGDMPDVSEGEARQTLRLAESVVNEVKKELEERM